MTMTMEQLVDEIFNGPEYLTPTHLVDVEEFLSKIPSYDPDIDGLGLDATQCWELKNRPNKVSGYCYIKIKGDLYNAARVAYELFIGPLGREPNGRPYEPDHICFNRSCVNPHHLRRMTKYQNILASNGASAINARKSKCIRGHRFDKENTYIRPTGGRRCRECERMRSRGEI